MSITAYTGLPGHGKSHGVVEYVIKPALEQRREIWTNIPVNSDECEKRFGFSPIQFKTQDILDNPNWWTEVFTPGAVIVIDEAWRLWPAGLKATNVRPEYKSFLAEHRHMVGENGKSTEIVLVTQDLSQITSFARVLVETTFRVVKLSKLGFDQRYRIDIFSGPVTGPNPSISKREREIYGKFNSEIFALYKSHTMSKTGSAGDETRTDQRFQILSGGIWKIGAIVSIVMALLAYFGIQNVIQTYAPVDSPPITQSSSPTLVSPQPVQSAPVRPTTTEPMFKFLSNAEAIDIVLNLGKFPKIQYRYRVVFDDYESEFTDAEFAALQYEIYPINNCTVKIIGPDFRGVAMCEREDPQRGWVENIVTGDST